MGAFRLSRKAAGRLKQIYVFSASAFGETQAEAYFESLQLAFDRIASHPHIGRTVEGRSHYRRYVHRRHSIFYEVENGTILILDILGAGQDPERHLPDR